MKLAAGATIGVYEVVAPLGEGGMGEVYRARDTKLRRDVALKILPDDFSADERRLSRFRREAELLASLNHPNIAAIYGLEDTPSASSEHGGVHALVLELVEGGTLADRIARGPIPIPEALTIAGQIADALDAAHEKGIIHRDLKPANIAITAGGTVKVLDFGLATVHEPVGTDATTAPTMEKTMPGTVLGTPSYMAPEQAAGGSVDRSADLWAFGCVVYEMIAGRRAFGGGTVSEILRNVLGSEPDYRRVPERTPDSVRRLLRRCLQKDPKRRLRDIRDARLELDDAVEGTSSAAREPASRPARHERLVWASALVIVGLIALGLAGRARRAVEPAAEIRFEIPTPPSVDASLAISPDGLKIVYTGMRNNVSQLWLRPLASPTAAPIAGTEGGSAPFWSPDSRSIGFFTGTALKRVDVDGGVPRTLSTPVPTPSGGTWRADGTVLFGANPNGPLLRVSSDGGEAVPATTLSPGERSHSSPRFLEDGRRFLFFVEGSPELRGVYVGTLGLPGARRLLETEGPAILTAAGPLLFMRQGTVWVQHLDRDRLELQGAAVAMDAAPTGEVILAGSAAGPVAFRRFPHESDQRRFTWVSRSGKVLREVEYTDGASIGPALSHDGSHVAVFRFANGNMDIWSFAVNRQAWDRITVDTGDDIFPVWSPDGTELIFGSRRSGNMDLYRKRVGSQPGDEVRLLSSPEIKFPMDWSRDGKFLLYNSVDAKRGADIWALPLGGSPEPVPVVQTEFNELFPQASPSGRWIAYQSNRSGRPEIYVRPFPGDGIDVPVSNQGGTQPRWHPNGKELFYVAPDDRLMSVPLRFSADERHVEPEQPRELFTTTLRSYVGGVVRQRYAVAPDGESFLMNWVSGDVASLPITVILNWKPPAR